MMKKVLFGAAAAMAIAAPAHAATGYIEASYAHNEYDPGSDSFGAVALGGAVQEAFSNGWNVQGNAFVNELSWDSSSGDDAMAQATVHAFYRNDKYAVGGFVGLGSWYDDALRTVGAEAQWYMPNMTLGASVNITDNEYQYSSFENSWGITGEGTYFINDNLGINAGLNYTKFNDNGGSNDVDDWNGTIGVEYQLASAPVSLFANYTHSNLSPSSGSDWDSDAFKIGARLNLGTGSLKERSTTGASMTGDAGIIDQWTNLD